MISHKQKSLRDRLALQFFLLTSLTIATLTIVAIVVAGAHVRQRVMLQLASETSAKEDLIEQRLKQDWEHLSLWSRQADIQDQTALNNLYVNAQEEGIPLVGIGYYSVDGELAHSIGSLPENSLAPKVGGGAPIVTNEGWVGHMVVVPLKNDLGDVNGFVVGQFDMRETLHALLNVSEIGETAELLLGTERDGNLILLHHRYVGGAHNISIGPLSQHIARNDPLARSVLRQEGVIRATNYEDRDVFAAYKYLPRLGWGLVITLDASEALIGVWAIGIAIVTVGLLLLGMAILLAVSFSTRLTAPLQKMSEAMAELGPNNWDYKATATTNDEVQLIDTTVQSMAKRLEELYDNLEQQVKDRTTELREQYEVDKAILQSAQHGILLVTPDGHIKSMNPAAARYLCRDATLCQNLPVEQIFRLFRQHHPVEANKHPILHCLRSGKPVMPKADVLWSLQNSAGDLLAIDLTVTPVFTGQKIIGAVAVFRDVSEERHVDEVKSEFISLASHQLRTPLSVIKWYTELLEGDENDQYDEQQSIYLLEIRNAGDRMANLVDALLQAAQLESKGILAEKVEVQLNTFVADLEQELETLAKDKNIDCQINLPKEHIVLSTDPVLLHIVIQNLFSNAVKYTNDKGSVSISLQKKGSVATIKVTDTGIGIPSADREKIFQRLFRAENAKKSVTDGSGLGLYISRMILEILGGEITFTSKEGKGTIFTVQLPIE